MSCSAPFHARASATHPQIREIRLPVTKSHVGHVDREIRDRNVAEHVGRGTRGLAGESDNADIHVEAQVVRRLVVAEGGLVGLRHGCRDQDGQRSTQRSNTHMQIAHITPPVAKPERNAARCSRRADLKE